MYHKDIPVFVGYDDREDEVYSVCKYSLEKHCGNVKVYPLKHRELRKEKFLTRPWAIEGETGRYVDTRDGRNFSTQFSHSRFLTPLVAKEKYGYDDLAIFVDCDFVFLSDINKLIEEVRNQAEQSVYVVKHNFQDESELKMDGQVQIQHPRKLWSSLMVFNLAHKDTQQYLTKNYVNHEDGRQLHKFSWTTAIGDIPEGWNFIPDHSEPRVMVEDIHAIHYTKGGPWFEEYKDCSYADVYNTFKYEALHKAYVDDAIEEQLRVYKASKFLEG